MILHLLTILGTWAWLIVVWLSGWTLAAGIRRVGVGKTEVRPPAVTPDTAFLVGVLGAILPLYGVLGVVGGLGPSVFIGLLLMQAILAGFGIREVRRWWRENRSLHGTIRVMAVWAVVLGILASLVPLWGYDAQAIYGLKAKILADQGNIHGADFCDPYRVHFGSNYPLVVPLLEAQVFFWRNSLGVVGVPAWNDLGMGIIFWGFITALVFQMINQVARFAPQWTTGVGLLFALTPMLWRWAEGAGLSGSADVVLAAFVFGGICHLAEALGPGTEQHRAPIVFGALFFGGACLTKQEGLLCTALAIALFFGAHFWKRTLAQDAGQRAGFLDTAATVGLILLLLVPVGLLFWLVHGQMPRPIYSRSYLAALNPEWLSRLSGRPLGVLRFAAGELVNNRWGLLWVVFGLSMLLPRTRPIDISFRFLKWFVVLLILAYCAIFVVTPYPLHYHLYTAFARLMFHGLPVVVLITVEQLSAVRWTSGLEPSAPGGKGEMERLI